MRAFVLSFLFLLDLYVLEHFVFALASLCSYLLAFTV